MPHFLPTARPLLARACASLLGLCALAPLLQAQVSLGGLPEGLVRPLGPFAPRLESPAPELARLLAEDEARGHRPLRYGALIDLDATLADGQWLVQPDGSKVWRLELSSPGAHSLAVEFARFELPQGAELFVYDQPGEPLLGAYTAANRHSDGSFVFEPFPGDRLTLELDLPVGAGEAVLELRSLIHDYRDVFALMSGAIEIAGAGQDGDGSCLIDVNCAQGDNWQLQKQATVRTLSDGALCSGALLNNTANDGTPYVLTANHCGQGTNTIFTFLYETAGCATGSAPTNKTVSGCQVLTTNATYDNRLLQISGSIPAAYTPYFAGWSRSTNNATLAIAMGHPSGGPKKICIDSNGTALESTLWRVAWSEGTLEGGSSGGPLFDQNGRVKGPACCVSSFVCSGQTAWFGRFDKFYTSNSLAQYLDPLGTNPTTLDGFDPSNPGGGGGGGTAPTISAVTPASIPALALDGQSLTLTGTNFDKVTAVSLDGVLLASGFPPQWSVSGSTSLTITLPLLAKLGTVDIALTATSGNVSSSVLVLANDPPVIDLVNSDPSFLFNFIGVQTVMGGVPGDLCFLCISPELLPTSLPGLASFDIGNNLASLIYLGAYLPDLTKGWVKANFPISSPLPTGTKLYVQTATYRVQSGFPLLMSNTQSGTILF